MLSAADLNASKPPAPEFQHEAAATATITTAATRPALVAASRTAIAVGFRHEAAIVAATRLTFQHEAAIVAATRPFIVVTFIVVLLVPITNLFIIVSS
jgi:hypothetical protein